MTLIGVTAHEEAGLIVQLADSRLALTVGQVQALYALAESDWGWLSHAVLADRISQQGATVPPGQLTADLEGLKQQQLIREHTPGDATSGPAAALTERGLMTITALTREWSGWADYCQSVGLSHY
ncbi:MAG: hypothetical protein R3300_12635 [Candidatus Promineifilaceae bacterium]|nr:hypothetical protein [Candidatus Promineifilaceae bacterium]